MNCRLCDKNLTGKNGRLLYDYDDNIETKLGRKINTILNTSVSKSCTYIFNLNELCL